MMDVNMGWHNWSQWIAGTVMSLDCFIPPFGAFCPEHSCFLFIPTFIIEFQTIIYCLGKLNNNPHLFELK